MSFFDREGLLVAGTAAMTIGIIMNLLYWDFLNNTSVLVNSLMMFLGLAFFITYIFNGRINEI